jgi:hypothetical protein
MSFVHIKDPEKRDEIVADYLVSLVQKKPDINHLQEHTNLQKSKEDVTKNEQDAVKVNETNILDHKIVRCFGILDRTTVGKHQMVNELHIGNGIQFLPGDINGLQIKLDYLLAEYHAGNTSATRNQIVAIADELLRRKQISQAKYNNINNFIKE